MRIRFYYTKIHIPTKTTLDDHIDIGPARCAGYQHLFSKFPTQHEVYIKLLEIWNSSPNWIFYPIKHETVHTEELR